MSKVIDFKDYYKAYEKRYEQVHEKNMLWASKRNTPDVIDFLNKYKVSKKDKILDLGCGEGRDAIYLLKNGYNVLALDYSKEAIDMCKKLSDNKYNSNFKQFDIMEDRLDEKFKYIYSIAVLHMFVLKEHRDKFLSFVRTHLEKDGRCLICVLGDGKQEHASDIRDAFKDARRVVMNNDVNLNVATTSCRIVKWEDLESEILENNLIIENRWISKVIPEFNNCMCVVIKAKE